MEPELPPLPQDPPTTHATIGSTVDPNGLVSTAISLTDTESYTSSRRSSTSNKIRTTTRGSRSSKESWIHEEITRTYKKLQYQLQDERRRADEAERRLVEVTAHLKTVNEARLIAMQDAAQAKEDLRLYKMQLDRAQREIYRAQDMITEVDQQRHAAEKEAAKSRSKARQLNETLMVQAAREEAWRLGLQEGLNQGRNIALAAELATPAEQYPPHPPPFNGDDDYNSEASASTATRQLHEPASSQFPIRTQSPVSTHSRSHPEPPPQRPRSISSLIIPPPVARSVTQQPNPDRPASIEIKPIKAPEPIRPISVHNAPSPLLPRNNLPIPDNLIPSLDADNRIRIPPPFEFSRTPEPDLLPSAPLATVSSNTSMEALPIPPPVHQNQHQQSRSSRRPGLGGHRRNSSSGSSSLSALEIIKEPFGGGGGGSALGLRTPMSVIPEVMSQYTGSPLPQSVDGDHGMRHQPSLHESFHPPSQRSHSPAGSRHSRISETPSRHHHHHHHYEQDPDDNFTMASHHKNPSSQELSNTSSPPEIDIQPPSRPLSYRSDANSLRGIPVPSKRTASPSSSSRHRFPLPTSSSSTAGGVGVAGPSRPSSIMTSHTIPGGFYNQVQPLQIETRHKKHSSTSEDHHQQDQLDSAGAVSSALSADTLTTPPDMYRTLTGGGSSRHHRPESVTGGGSVRAGSPVGSSSSRRTRLSGFGNVEGDGLPPPNSAATTDDMTGVGTGKKGKKGRKK